METTQNKNNTLQVLRGLAIIVVLIHHSISRTNVGLVLQSIDDILICFHMPVFFIIAGYLYQNKINKYESMKKGRFLYTGTMRELLNKARGHVWECCTEDESLARELERKYHISSKQYTEEGIRLRLLGENMPSESGCIACDVTLEDAYIYVTNR